MWFAVLDGLVVGAVVALALLRPWQRARVGSSVAVLSVGLAGGLVGAGLGFTLVAGSTSSGPLQVTPIIAGLVGALLTLILLRSWVLGDRAAAVAAVAAEQARVAAATKARLRQERRARRAAREPSALAEIAVLALAALRRR